MRRVLGEAAFGVFIGKARFELEDLSRQAAPWSPALAERGVNVAMLLGLESLERACRTISDDGEAASANPIELAAAAAKILIDITQR